MIIGLNGGMGVGKTTAAELINDISYRNVKVIKFAAPLYDMQEFIYRRISQVYPKPASFVKDRVLLQWLGTEWGRGTISPSLWIDLWRTEALKALSDGFVVVCDDVRFDNEAQVIRNLNGLVINIKSIHAEERTSTVRGLTNHATERGIDSSLVSRYVRNDGTEKEFKEKLTALLKEEGLRVGTKKESAWF